MGTRVNNIAMILQYDNMHQHIWQNTYQGIRWGRIVILGRRLYGHVLTIPHTYCNMRIYIRTYGKIYTRTYGKIYTRAWGSKVKLLNTDLNKKINLLGRVARILKTGPVGRGLQIQAFESGFE